MRHEAITPAARLELEARHCLAEAMGISALARRTLGASVRGIRPRTRLTRIEWAERFRVVATGARTGPFAWDVVPSLRGIMQACDDATVHEVVVQKPSQIGYTVSILLNLLGYHIHQDPCSILVLFPKDAAAKKFEREKLRSTIRSTPVLSECIDVNTRNSLNTSEYKEFRGGFLQMSGANSPSNVKSTDARLGCVEEPDDVTHDVKEQGSPIDHIKARTKTFPNRFVLIGGSPTLDGFSAVQAEMQLSDKRRGFVRCPHCNHQQTLNWENVEWLSDADVQHPIYGTHRPDTARYRCDNEECGTLWSDREKNAALADCDWIPTAAFNGIAGFDYSTGGELYSAIAESKMAVLVRRYLEAKDKSKKGDDSKMREFNNGTLGRVWRIQADAPEVDELESRVETYAEWTVPAGGLMLVASVDVQRGGELSGEPRLEYLFRAFGRGMESWKVANGQIIGNPLERHVWIELESIMARAVKNQGGGALTMSAMSVDSSDGMTSESVYRFGRKHKSRGVMAVKGLNETGPREAEIFNKPKQIDHTQQDKAARFGLRVYMIGTSKAKSQIHGRLKLAQDGPGRVHFDAGTTREYFEQLTAEAQIPGRRGRLVWTKKAGASNEALDLEVMCLHAAHKLNLHRWDDNRWDAQESRVRQGDLWSQPRSSKPATKQPPASSTRNESTGFGSDGWTL